MNTQQTKAGQLDPSFNGGKPLELAFAGYQRHILYGMTAGRDGLIYVSGARFKGVEFSSSEYFIVALDAQGRRYEGFDRDGVAAGSFFKADQPGVSVRCYTFALHYEQGATPADDRLYLLGQYTYKRNDEPESTYPAVACYLVNGSPDMAFGTDGICVFAGLEGDSVPPFASPAPVSSSTQDGETQELPNPDASLRWGVYDRRFYIQGRSGDQRRTLLIVVDFQGAIDWSFGINGVQVVDRGLRFIAVSIFTSADGIYLSGHSVTNESLGLIHATTARLDHSGVPDASFGSNGFKDFELDAVWAGIEAVAPLSVGQIVAAGFVRPDMVAQYKPVLLSYDLRGNPNPGFNGGAPVFADDATGRWLSLVTDEHAVTVLGDVSGSAMVGRFLLDGSLDRSFADGAGWRLLAELPPGVRPRNLMVRPDRSIVLLAWWPFDESSRSAGVVGVLTGQ
jgi:hypothetical protein